MSLRRPAVLALGAAVAGVAVALRAWRLAWGLADGDFFFDEWIFATQADRFVPLSPGSSGVATDPYLVYPPLYGYLAGATFALGRALGVLGGPFTHFLAARLVSTTAGVATVGIAGLAAARLYGPPAGLAAAALLAIAPLHAMHSHIAATDVTLTAAMALTLLCAWSLATGPTCPRAALAGMAAGLAFATKYTGLAALAPVGWALVEGAWRRRVPRLGLGLAALAGFAAAVALACPPCLLRPDRLLAAMARHRELTELAPFAANRLTGTLGWHGRPYLYPLAASLPYGLGWPLYALALLGIAVALRRRTLADRLVLTAILPYFVTVGGARVTFPRYFLPLFPPLVILAGRALATAAAAPAARGALLGGVWLYSLALTASQVARFSWDQQRAAAAWIRAAAVARAVAPGDVRVAVPRIGADYFGLDRALVRAGLQHVPVADGHWLDRAADALVVPEWYAIAARRDPLPRALADLERLESGTGGYRLGARWRSTYLQERFYTRLDPAFAADLWQGEIGLSVYLHDAGRLAPE